VNAAGGLIRAGLLWVAGSLAVFAATPEEDLHFAALGAERHFERSGLLLDAPAISAYLQGTLQKLVDTRPGAGSADCRVYLLRGQHANAFALPNCRLYVSTALFLALENEAQLTAIYARELAHVRNQSALKYHRSLKQEFAFWSTLGTALAAGAGVSPGSSRGKNYPVSSDAVGDLIWRVSIRGYSDELELQADRDALALLRIAGQRQADALRALENLRAAARATSEASSVPLLASRDTLNLRIANLRRLASDSLSGASPASATHAALAATLRLEQIRLLVESGDRLHAQQLLSEMEAAGGESGRSRYLAGELARLNGVTTREEALAAYAKGATFADAPAQLFLNQGMMLREAGDEVAARQAFTRYLEMAPDSLEATLVRRYLQPAQAPKE
jgi:beta-barrel assembly-enhancing protease